MVLLLRGPRGSGKVIVMIGMRHQASTDSLFLFLFEFQNRNPLIHWFLCLHFKSETKTNYQLTIIDPRIQFQSQACELNCWLLISWSFLLGNISNESLPGLGKAIWNHHQLLITNLESRSNHHWVWNYQLSHVLPIAFFIGPSIGPLIHWLIHPLVHPGPLSIHYSSLSTVDWPPPRQPVTAKWQSESASWRKSSLWSSRPRGGRRGMTISNSSGKARTKPKMQLLRGQPSAKDGIWLIEVLFALLFVEIWPMFQRVTLGRLSWLTYHDLWSSRVRLCWELPELLPCRITTSTWNSLLVKSRSCQ